MKTKFKKSGHSKNFIKSILVTLFLFTVSLSFSQAVTIELINVAYLNNPQNSPNISNCGEIDLITTPNTNVSLQVKLTKSVNDNNYTDGYIRLIIKPHYNNAGTGYVLDIRSVGFTEWSVNNNIKTVTKTINNLQLPTGFFDYSNGILFAVYEPNTSSSKYFSCEYDIVKNPRFTMNHSNLSIPCTNTTPVTFTVTNVHNHPGSLSYQWSIGSGWLLSNGNPAPSSITTSSNTLTLTPNANPPSNVSVVPILNGTSYPTLTSVVSLSELIVGEISGVDQICTNSNGTFSISNVPSNTTITWSLTPSNIANIVSSNGSNVTVEGVANGITTLKAVITNSCNQIKTITKPIQIGGAIIQGVTEINPNSIFHLLPFRPDCLVGLKLNIFPSNAGIINYEWQKISSNFQWSKDISANVNDDEVVINVNSNKTISFKVRTEDNQCGWSNWVTINYTITSCGTNNGNNGSGNGGIDSDNFSIYPVPASTILHVDINSSSGPFFLSNGDVYIVKLYKSGVGYVREITSTTSNIEIDVTGLTSGYYILEIYYNSIQESHGILIN